MKVSTIFLNRLRMVSIIYLLSLFFVNESYSQRLLPKKYLKSGNLHVFSIAVDKNNPGFSHQFKNCVSDAKIIDSLFILHFKSYFNEKTFVEKLVKPTDNLVGVNNDYQHIYKYQLFDSAATEKNINNIIYQIINNSKPEDYFVFFFSGSSFNFETNGISETYFRNYITGDVNHEIPQGISLKTLRDKFELINCHNQIIITQAGETQSMTKEITQLLLENNLSVAKISVRNRIILTPYSVGVENTICTDKTVPSGPLPYYISQLPMSCNIFGLLEGGARARVVTSFLDQINYQCNPYKFPYINYIFEKDIIGNLEFFVRKQGSNQRGGKLLASPSNNDSHLLQKNYALLIGTNTYAAKDSWSTLANAVSDTRKIAKTLKEQYDFEIIQLENPDQDSIIAKLYWLSKNLDSNSNLLIYFAGHGDYEEVFLKDGFLVCSNSKSPKEDPFRKTYLPYSRLETIIDNLKAKHILLVLDVCYSGTFDKRLRGNITRSGNTKDLYDVFNKEQLIKEKSRLNSRIYITSGSKNEVPDGIVNSPFAILFNQALETKGGNYGLVSTSDLFPWIEKLRSKPLKGDFGSHQPGGEFLFIPK